MGINISKKKNVQQPGDSRFDRNSDILIINCRGCTQFPDCSSPVCISCICEAVALNGTAEKIRLESTKDTELSGTAAEIMCDLAKVNRPMIIPPSGRRCSGCPRSPDSIISSIWSDFPDPNFKSGCARLYSERTDGPECTACMQRTYTALITAENEMEKIKEKASKARNLKGAFQ